MLDEGTSYDDVRAKYGMAGSTLRRYSAALKKTESPEMAR